MYGKENNKFLFNSAESQQLHNRISWNVPILILLQCAGKLFSRLALCENKFGAGLNGNSSYGRSTLEMQNFLISLHRIKVRWAVDECYIQPTKQIHSWYVYSDTWFWTDFSLMICSARRAIVDSPKLAIHSIHRRQALSQLIVAAKSTCRGQRFSLQTKSTLSALNHNSAYN